MNKVIWQNGEYKLENNNCPKNNGESGSGGVSEETFKEALKYKLNILVSGQNIKTINKKNILGYGDLTIESGSKYDDSLLISDINNLRTDTNKLIDLINNTIINLEKTKATKESLNNKLDTLQAANLYLPKGDYLKTIPSEYVTNEDLNIYAKQTWVTQEIQKALIEGGGVQGPEGKSAYQIAQKNGFSGTELEWLKSLKGSDGLPGKPGPQGIPGKNGSQGPKGDPGVTPDTSKFALKEDLKNLDLKIGILDLDLNKILNN